MKKSKFTEEQITYALRQVEAGTPAVQVCRSGGRHGADATHRWWVGYRWKRKYAGMGVAELRRLKQLEDENTKLKRLVADLTLDKHIAIS